MKINTPASLKLCILFVGVVLFSACGAREEFVVSRLDVVQNQWDTLGVSVAFARRTVLNHERPTPADSLYIVAYNNAYDTLYAGSDTLFSIPDANMGNRERILLEVCAQVKLIQVCEQTAAEASPKRVRLSPDIAYPWRERYYQGSYRLPFIVERQPYGTEDDQWEPIKRSKSIEGFIRTYVAGREDAGIRFPFKSNQGGFNLTHHTNYKDFKFYLDSELLDHNEANVQFDVYVNIDGIPETVGSITKAVALKSDEERQVEIAELAKLAASQIVERLSSSSGRQRNIVYIDSWTYNTFNKNYIIELELEWTRRSFSRTSYSLQGVLTVDDQGEVASFRLLDGNRRARRLWERRVDNENLVLDTLSTFEQDRLARTAPLLRGPSHDYDGETIVIESEEYQQTVTRNDLSWSLYRKRRGYSGNGAMVVLPDRDVRVREQLNQESPSLSYNVDFPEQGRYYVWMRMWAEDGNSNSAYLGLDNNSEREAIEMTTNEFRKWVWTNNSVSRRGPARIDLNGSGIHSLRLWMREDGLLIDRILLTQDPDFRPGSVQENALDQSGFSSRRSSSRSLDLEPRQPE